MEAQTHGWRDTGVSTHINPQHDGDLAFWARILDASPEELRRAIEMVGSEIAAVRSFLSGRQLHLDFGVLTFEGLGIGDAEWQTS